LDKFPKNRLFFCHDGNFIPARTTRPAKAGFLLRILAFLSFSDLAPASGSPARRGFFFPRGSMATEFIITAEQNPEKFSRVGFENGVEEFSFDFSPWAEDNSDIETVTWTVRKGQVEVDGEELAENIATAQITFGQTGKSLVEIKAVGEDGETYIAYLEILVKDLADVEDFGDYT
jgi:hypothetical protein